MTEVQHISLLLKKIKTKMVVQMYVHSRMKEQNLAKKKNLFNAF